MGRHDLAFKKFFRRKANFASFANGALHGGREVVKPGDVFEVSETVIMPSDRDPKRNNEGRRDIIRLLRRCRGTMIEFLFVGIESQTTVDKRMPIRTFVYDGGTYRTQLEDPSQARIYPVITFVLHFGKTRWTGPRTLREALDLSDETWEEIKDYFNDYKLNVIDVRFMTTKEIEKLSGAFRLLANICTRLGGKRCKTHKDRIEDPRLACEIVQMLNPDADPDELGLTDDEIKEQTVETFVDAILKKRESKGKREGLQEGERKGERKGEMKGKHEYVEKMRSKGWSFEQIADLMDTTVEEIRRIACFVPAGV